MAVMEAPRNPTRRSFPTPPPTKKLSADACLGDGRFLAETTIVC